MATEYRSRRSRLGVLLGLMLLALLVLGVYLLQQRGYSLQETLSSVKENSEDAATTAKVKASLALSKQVSGHDIDVKSDQGAVTLRGQVPSDSVRNLAGTIAADTAGVVTVQNLLTVDPAAQPDPELSRLAERIAELEIKAAIRDGIDRVPELRNAEVEVVVQGHDVDLRGQVATLEQKVRVGEIATATDGVEKVSNVLEVVSTTASADSPVDELARRVEFELYSTKAFALETLQIRVEGTTVALDGTVRSLAERLLAEKVAAQVPGVDEVVNRLQVRGAVQAG